MVLRGTVTRTGGDVVGAQLGRLVARVTDPDAILEDLGRVVLQALEDTLTAQGAPIGVGWAPLSAATIRIRLAQGTGTTPLVATGRLRDGVVVRIDPPGDSVSVGWEFGQVAQIATWQQLGTRTIPARPFVGSSLPREATDQIRAIIDEYLTSHIPGRNKR